jgi:hypothetical protein
MNEQISIGEVIWSLDPFHDSEIYLNKMTEYFEAK